MKWLKWTILVIGVLVLILAALPFFISLDDFIPEIEKQAAERLKEPVKIGSLRAAALPLPHLTVDGITVGKTGDIQVGRVTVTPDLWSLLGPTKVIKSIEVERLVLTQKALEKIPAWTRPEGAKPAPPGEPPALRVESVRLEEALVKLAKASFGPFDARLDLSGAGDLESASIVTKDGKLRAEVRPEKANYRIDAVAKSWTPPAGPPVVLDELAVKGVATHKDAVLEQVRARLYGGTVSGRTTVAWHKGVQIRGSAEVSQVELKQLVPLLAPGTNMSGKLSAKPVFSAAAREAGQLMNALRLETPFSVQDGVLYGVDIGKAATSILGKDGAKGGETRFDQLSGHLVLDRGTYRFTNLNVASGALAADGNVTISPKQELSGRINASVKAGSVTAANVPLNVSGTVHSPLLLPTAGYVAGAAAGTAVLGPGLGTSVGATVGGWTERLFGRKEEKKK
ncbi:MAG TPA: AsmA-like C-terminal region-containing protein [Burkholderiales bacterium]|nr:AsmA-like C-terminal region-containing protein [Burkholderiales bacterium]